MSNNMSKTAIKDELQRILGEEAANNNGQVPENIRRMYRALNYIEAQLPMLKRLVDDPLGKTDIDQVYNSLSELILSNEK